MSIEDIEVYEYEEMLDEAEGRNVLAGFAIVAVCAGAFGLACGVVLMWWLR